MGAISHNTSFTQLSTNQLSNGWTNASGIEENNDSSPVNWLNTNTIWSANFTKH